MSNSIVKDVRVDTTNTTFYPIINLYNGKSIIMQNGKPKEWKTIDELIDFYQVGQTIYINDINLPYNKVNQSALDKLFKHFNCWYSASFTSSDQANLILEKGAECVVYNLDLITPSLIESVDNKKLVMSLLLPKHRNRENDNKLFELLKSNGKYIKYLILNLNQEYNAKEVIETTTQIYDLFRKDDELEDVKMGVNARNIISRTELQLLIGSGVDPHIGYPIHNDLLKLGEVYSLLLNDILQSNHLNLLKNGLPYYPTIIQDLDGNVYQTYYSTKNTLEKTVNKRYGVYWSRELHKEFKIKKQIIKHIYFSRDKTSLLFVVDININDTDLNIPFFTKYKNPVRRRLDWLTPTTDLIMRQGEFIKKELFETINSNLWSNAFQHLVNLISLNNQSLSEILDNTMNASMINYPILDTNITHTFISKLPFDTDKLLTIVTNCEYYAKDWLKTSGLKYELISVDNDDNDLIKRFNDSVCNTLFLKNNIDIDIDIDKLNSLYKLILNTPLYYKFDKSTEIVEDNDDRIVKKVDDYYLSLFKKNSYQQYLLLEKLALTSEYPFIKSLVPPSEVKIKMNDKGYIIFQKESITISDDEATDYFDDLANTKLFICKLYEKIKNPFIVDLSYNDLTINYIKLY